MLSLSDQSFSSLFGHYLIHPLLLLGKQRPHLAASTSNAPGRSDLQNPFICCCLCFKWSWTPSPMNLSNTFCSFIIQLKATSPENLSLTPPTLAWMRWPVTVHSKSQWTVITDFLIPSANASHHPLTLSSSGEETLHYSLLSPQYVTQGLEHTKHLSSLIVKKTNLAESIL